MRAKLNTITSLLLSALFLLILNVFSPVDSAASETVVVYTALDQIYSEPVLKAFKTQTGIAVKAVYDVEATKTIGLVNRLIAEQPRPQCDVFWNNEVVNSVRLKKRGLTTAYHSPQAEDIPAIYKDPDGHWHGFAARARVFVFNTRQSASERPTSISDFVHPKWRDKATMAYPLFGTTATHAVALFQMWGNANARKFFEEMKQNGVAFVDGNSVVRDRVADGTCLWGITDTDDAFSGMQRGMPIAMTLPDQDDMGTLVIPNTVCLIKNAPHPTAARKLIDFILSEATERMLAKSGSGQIPLRPGLRPVEGIPALSDIRQMKVDYDELADRMETILPILDDTL